MGTISDKLMRIINTKEDIRQALISKGYDVPTSIPFKEYAKMILDLPCNADSFPDIEGIVARYSASGLTNEQMAANPVWVDKTGNGYDLQLKNFSWGGMSGVGGYVDNWNSSADWVINSYWVNSHTDHKLQFITASSVVQARSNNIYNAENVYKNILNVNGLTEAVNKGSVKFLRIIATDPITSKVIKTFSFETDGVIQISFDDVLQDYYVCYFFYGSDTKDIDITIEQLPLYPGALVFDGVDDYGVCENFPILTKEKGYTVVALRQWISMGEGISGLVSNVKNWFNDGAFVLECNGNNATNKFVNRPVSFGNVNIEMDLPNNFTYQTSKSYKGVPITTGSFKGTNSLFVGKLNNIIGNYSNVAIWELVFLDHDATEEELTKIKDFFVKTYPWLFPNQAWTVTGKTNEDEDRATIANITGNGNDLVLSNFGFAEGSGYGLYAYNFNSFNLKDNVVKPTDVKKDSFRIIGTGDNSNVLVLSNTSNSADWKIRITGMKEGDRCLIGNANKSGEYISVNKDGTYTFQKQYAATSTNGIWYNSSQEVDVLVEQIPEYEGYLVTDGVDDKAVSKQFKFGENFTVILDFKFPVKKISYCGFDLSSKVRIQNLQGSGVYVVLKGNKTLIPSNVVRAVTSEGKVYDENWNEYNIVPGNISSNYTMVNLGFDGSNQFAESATKLAGIYSSILSKDECIKAYNYLQTLKSK